MTLETYEPKKSLKEFLAPTVKPLLFTLILLTIIFATIDLTQKYNLEFSMTGSAIQGNSKLEKVTTSPETSTNSNPVKIYSVPNYPQLISKLSSDPIVNNLPNDAIIELKFYNFNTGQRTWEKSYILKKDSIQEGTAQEKDFKILIHSKYVNEIKNKDLCTVAKQAKTNGDFGVESNLSELTLMWKYKSMLEYQDCLL